MVATSSLSAAFVIALAPFEVLEAPGHRVFEVPHLFFVAAVSAVVALVHDRPPGGNAGVQCDEPRGDLRTCGVLAAALDAAVLIAGSHLRRDEPSVGLFIARALRFGPVIIAGNRRG